MSSARSASKDTFDIYDFDHTIYDGDCSLDFYIFCLGKSPSLIKYLPSQVWHFARFQFKYEDRTAFKTHFFQFLRGINDITGMIEIFWGDHYKNIKSWYIDSNHTRDIIISASPEFLLLPAASKLGVAKLIATRMDPETGVIEGKNCRGEEKVARLRAVMGDIKVDKVHTDSKSDKPLLDLAERRYIVKKHKITELESNRV